MTAGGKTTLRADACATNSDRMKKLTSNEWNRLVDSTPEADIMIGPFLLARGLRAAREHRQRMSRQRNARKTKATLVAN